MQRHCSVSAKLKDPEAANETPLVLFTATGDEITLTHGEGRDRLRSGEFLKQGGVANVRLHQSRLLEKTIRGHLPEECNGLSECIVWGSAKLEVWMALDELCFEYFKKSNDKNGLEAAISHRPFDDPTLTISRNGLVRWPFDA